MNRTYRKYDEADSSKFTWLTEVTVDKLTAHSRPATPEEIDGVLTTEKRAEADIAQALSDKAELEALREFKAKADAEAAAKKK